MKHSQFDLTIKEDKSSFKAMLKRWDRDCTDREANKLIRAMLEAIGTANIVVFESSEDINHLRVLKGLTQEESFLVDHYICRRCLSTDFKWAHFQWGTVTSLQAYEYLTIDSTEWALLEW
jgi:hypothetical protein